MVLGRFLLSREVGGLYSISGIDVKKNYGERFETNR